MQVQSLRDFLRINAIYILFAKMGLLQISCLFCLVHVCYFTMSVSSTKQRTCIIYEKNFYWDSLSFSQLGRASIFIITYDGNFRDYTLSVTKLNESSRSLEREFNVLETISDNPYWLGAVQETKLNGGINMLLSCIICVIGQKHKVVRRDWIRLWWSL